MEDEIPKDHIDSFMNLHDSDSLNSNDLSEPYMMTYTNENDNAFRIRADDGENQFISEFKMSDYVNMKEKDFITKVNNFKLLLETIEKAQDKNRVILSKENDFLKLTFYYTVIYDEKKISFELRKKSNEEEEQKENEKAEEEKKDKESEAVEEKKDLIDFKAEVVEYNKKFEEYGDRNIIRVLIENKGGHSWPKEKTSFRCAQEFSSLICKEYFLEDEVLPGEQIELALEFLKNQKENLKQPYITSLNLHVHPQDYEPMIVLDFSENYNSENIPFDGPEIKEEEDENKNIVINDVNIINETKDTSSENKEPEKIHISKGKTTIKKKVKTKVIETDSGPKEMTPFQRRIYELNKKEKERLEKEKERQQKTGWKKNF
jgi:hypothetical protein